MIILETPSIKELNKLQKKYSELNIIWKGEGKDFIKTIKNDNEIIGIYNTQEKITLLLIDDNTLELSIQKIIDTYEKNKKKLKNV